MHVYSKQVYTIQHLRNHCGFRVAFSNGFSVAFCNRCALVGGTFQRIVTFPVDFHWKFPRDFQWHFPMEFQFYDVWCVIFCPEVREEERAGPPETRGSLPSFGTGLTGT